jgi:hypothetical protein
VEPQLGHFLTVRLTTVKPQWRQVKDLAPPFLSTLVSAEPHSGQLPCLNLNIG